MNAPVETYAKSYLEVKWRYGKTSYEGSVDHYLCLNPTFCEKSKRDGAATAHRWLTEAASKQVKDGGNAFEATDPEGTTLQVDKQSLRRAFTGKGTPRDVLMTLWLATCVGQITADKSKENERCKSAKYYSHAYLGTDCNGFAMNYLGLDPGSEIDSLDKPQLPRRRKELIEIAAGDAMVVGKNYHHVAIVSGIEPCTKYKGSIRVNTWESLGPGLVGVCSQFRYMEKKSSGIFLERRNDGLHDDEFYFQPVTQRHAPNP